MVRTFLLMVAILLLGCEPEQGLNDSGPAAGDAGSTGAQDAGNPTDAGRPIDAGAVTADAGQTSPNDRVEALGSCDPGIQDPNLAGCQRYRVHCGGLPAADVKVRRWLDPLFDGEPAGTMVFGMGGTGTGWTVTRANDPQRAEHTLFRRLTRDGFTVLERAWTDGWWGDTSAGQGLAPSACRYRSLIAHFAEQDDHPLCVFGNSGGSSEIAYALTQHGLHEDIRLAILGGGPPMGRVDLGCALGAADTDWPEQCAEIWQETQTECGRRPILCGFNPGIQAVFDSSYGNTTCSAPSAEDLARMRSDSVVSPSAHLNYPETQVHFVHGRADCTEAPILGTLYWQAITSAKSRDLVETTPHRTIEHPNGARAVAEAIAAHCRLP